MSRQRVAWEGANPQIGEYLAGRDRAEAWLIAGVSPIHRPEPSGVRLTLDLRRVAKTAVPKGAVLHSRTRIASIDPDAPSPVRVQAGGGPTAVMRANWRDPDDMRVNARAPREVTGYRTFCPLRRMARGRGSQITEAHIAAADLFRTDADLAMIGLSGIAGETAQGVTYGPRFGPTRAALSQTAAGRAVARVMRRITPRHVPMLVAIVLMGRSLQAWCLEQQRTDPRVEMGRLLMILDTLVDHYASDVEAAVKAGVAV